MMTSTKIGTAAFLLAIAATLFPMETLRAQAGGFTFSCVGWDRIDGPPIHYLSGMPLEDEKPAARLGRLKVVDTPEMTRSESYEFRAGRTIGFYRKVNGTDGEPSLREVASCTVPAGWSKVLFVFFPGEGEDTYRLYCLSDDRAYAPYGSYQFVNLTPSRVTGFLDKQEFELDSKSSSVMRIRGDASRPIDFGLWTAQDGRKKWLLRNTLTYKPTKHLVYFLYAAPDRMGRMQMQTKGIVEFRPPPMEESGMADTSAVR